MNPLPDRLVIVGLLLTIALVFGLVFWSARLAPSVEPPLQWRSPGESRPAAPLI